MLPPFAPVYAATSSDVDAVVAILRGCNKKITSRAYATSLLAWVEAIVSAVVFLVELSLKKRIRMCFFVTKDVKQV